MNKRLFNRIKKKITAEAKSFDMLDWFVDRPGCGTTACIAGTACLLAGYKPGGGVLTIAEGAATARSSVTKSKETECVQVVAGKVLGLPYYEGVKLFFVKNWPGKFRRRYEAAKTPRGRASAACARIDYFLEHGE